jgi:hypothetical protein
MKIRPVSGLALLLMLALAPSIVQSQQVQATPAKPKTMKEMGEDHAMSGWKELDAFHAIMAATWAASKAPAACDTKSIRDAITAVVSQSKDLAKLVSKQAPDADVKAALRDVHMRFEVVEHGCHPNKKG